MRGYDGRKIYNKNINWFVWFVVRRLPMWIPINVKAVRVGNDYLRYFKIEWR